MTPKKLSAERLAVIRDASKWEYGNPHVQTVYSELLAHIAAVEFERDLAIAHDRQPYPTAEAYELACKTREVFRAERDALNEENIKLRTENCLFKVADDNTERSLLAHIEALRATWLEHTRHKDKYSLAELMKAFAADDNAKGMG